MKKWKKWEPTGEVSSTCEVVTGSDDQPFHERPLCGKPSTVAYPAMRNGYMSLCAEHGERHKAITVSIDAARRGESPDFMNADA